MQLVGTKEQPSLRDELAEVKAIALRSEKELHPNGGSSLRDDVRLVGRKVEASTELASRAAQRAEDTARQVENVAEAAHRERNAIQSALSTGLNDLEERMAVKAAEKTADWLELLADHGGPDLRPHLSEVPPHAHVLPQRPDPSMTGGPVPDPEE